MQDSNPRVKRNLKRVGVSGMRTIVITNWKGKEYRFVPEIELVLDLNKERRGVHMSRLIESVIESIEEESMIRHESLEELEKKILKRLKRKHPYRRAEISMDTELVISKKTPVTGKKTMETYDIRVSVLCNNDRYRKTLSVKVRGNTVCPHAMQKSNGRSHIQRADATLEIETSIDNTIELEEMVNCVEESFPSEVYTLLKTEDELHVVNKMFNNPMFIEDVTREILKKAKKRFKNCKIMARAVSYESIHRHNVIAEGSCRC